MDAAGCGAGVVFGIGWAGGLIRSRRSRDVLFATSGNVFIDIARRLASYNMGLLFGLGWGDTCMTWEDHIGANREEDRVQMPQKTD